MARDEGNIRAVLAEFAYIVLIERRNSVSDLDAFYVGNFLHILMSVSTG